MKNETEKKDRDWKGKKQKRDEASLLTHEPKQVPWGLGLACFDSEPGLLIGLFLLLFFLVLLRMVQ